MKAANKIILFVFVSLVLVAFRLWHPVFNFSPVAAAALFAGSFFGFRIFGPLALFGLLFLTDAALGFYPGMAWVYLGFGLSYLLGALWVRRDIPLIPYFSCALGSALLFFFLSNWGVWMTELLYPKTLEGLIGCYTAGIPFFLRSLSGDLFFASLFFLAHRLCLRAQFLRRSEIS